MRACSAAAVARILSAYDLGANWNALLNLVESKRNSEMTVPIIGTGRMVGHSSPTFWPGLDSMPNPEAEKVVYGCAVIQEQSGGIYYTVVRRGRPGSSHDCFSVGLS